MKKILLVLILAALLLVAAPAEAQRSGSVAKISGSAAKIIGIAATVNDDIVTLADVQNRLKLYLSGSSAKPSPAELKKLERDVLAKLIDEKLQLQEAKSIGITVGEDQVTGGFTEIARQNGLAPDDFRKRLASSGVTLDSLYDQIRAQIAWSLVVQRKLRPEVNVSESEIDSALDRLSKQNPAAPTGDAVISLKQILIPVAKKDPDNVIAAKIARAKDLQKEISSCADMAAKSKDFPSSGTGDMGEGLLSALPEPLRGAVAALKPDELSAPLRNEAGIAVVMVCSRKDAPVVAGDAPLPKLGDVLDKNDENARNKVATQIGMQRLDRLQEHYLQDLRATAFIEKRI